MIGGRAGESQHLASSDSPQSPQMISMLLRSCDIQLSDTCQQELNSKLGATALGMAKGEKGRDSSHPGNVFIGLINDPCKPCHMFYTQWFTSSLEHFEEVSQVPNIISFLSFSM